MGVSRRMIGPAVAASALLLHVSSRPADAQGATGRHDAVQQLNRSMASMVERVSKSVVQVS